VFDTDRSGPRGGDFFKEILHRIGRNGDLASK